MSNESINIPTITEIEAAAEIHSLSNSSAKVVCVKEQFAIRFESGITLSEAENMKFLVASSRISAQSLQSLC